MQLYMMYCIYIYIYVYWLWWQATASSTRTVRAESGGKEISCKMTWRLFEGRKTLHHLKKQTQLKAHSAKAKTYVTIILSTPLFFCSMTPVFPIRNVTTWFSQISSQNHFRLLAGSLPSRPSKWRPLNSFSEGDVVQGRVGTLWVPHVGGKVGVDRLGMMASCCFIWLQFFIEVPQYSICIFATHMQYICRMSLHVYI